MRKELGILHEERKRFEGTFIRFGEKKKWKGGVEKTVLVQNIRIVDEDKILADHIWFNYTQSFADAGFLKEGDVIVFDARVKSYTKGYVSNRHRIDERTQDFKLSHPTKVKRASAL